MKYAVAATAITNPGSDAVAAEGEESAQHRQPHRHVLAASDRHQEGDRAQNIAALVDEIDHRQHESRGDGLEVEVVKLQPVHGRIEQVGEREGGGVGAG